jgi:hypothetical protein
VLGDNNSFYQRLFHRPDFSRMNLRRPNAPNNSARTSSAGTNHHLGNSLAQVEPSYGCKRSGLHPFLSSLLGKITRPLYTFLFHRFHSTGFNSIYPEKIIHLVAVANNIVFQ